MSIIVYILIIILLFYFYINFKNNKQIIGGKKTNNKLFILIKVLLQCCKKLNLKYNLIDSNNIHIFHKNKVLKFRYAYSNINKNICKEITCNKTSINTILKNNNIKVPKHQVFNVVNSTTYINKIINSNKIKYPLVVKPIDSSGGNKVFVNIKNNLELKNILTKYYLNKIIPHSKTHKIMLEEYIKGTEYRILCYDNIILDVVKRTPGYIIGNGINTIEELINIKNKTNQYHKKHPLKLHKHHLNQMQLNTNSILKLNQKINPHYIGTITYGGYLERTPIQKVHKDNINMFKEINKILGLKICGIDVLIDDIGISYKNQICGINEVNSNPSILNSYYADQKYSIDIPLQLLKLYFNINN
mgnify:CR=1 FL=1